MTQTPSVYTAHDIPDLLNTLPTLFGFRPEESLVAVSTRGPRRRFGFRLRVDIPDPEDIDQLAEIVVGHLGRHGAEGAIFLAVTQQQAVARDLLAAIEERLAPIDLVVAARADGERYWSDEPGFPPDGIAYETSDHHLAVVQAIAAGQQILPDRQALVDRFAAVTQPRRGRRGASPGRAVARPYARARDRGARDATRAADPRPRPEGGAAHRRGGHAVLGLDVDGPRAGRGVGADHRRDGR
ncbi:hypothetical protein AERO9AM_30365 [Aeromicrobium sp. 9AM]|nr:hypothetical protein AERO9AM_30365 [Aeromicrobium sp. 9AM]